MQKNNVKDKKNQTDGFRHMGKFTETFDKKLKGNTVGPF